MHSRTAKDPLVKFIDGWDTVPEMEAALGIPEGNLVVTLERYNSYAARGEDPDFHKQPEFLAPQDQGPWGAFDLSLGKAMYAGFTVGGVVRARRTSPTMARATHAVDSWGGVVPWPTCLA